MPNYIEILNIEAEDLRDLSDVYFGYAESLIKKENKIYNAYIASCFVIAGVLKSIIEPGDGKSSFKKAAYYYQLEENDFWVVCLICANDTEELSTYLDDKEDSYGLELNVLDRILASAFSVNPRELADLSNQSIPVSRLNIPIKIFIDALQDLDGLDGDSKGVEKFDNIQTFLGRSSEYIRLLKGDSYHWQNLYGNFIPLEPEILAFCIVLYKKIKESRINFSLLMKRLELDSLSKFPLQIAKEIYEKDT